MCGVSGWSRSLESLSEKKLDTTLLTRTLLLEMEMRGRDATGIAWWRPPGTVKKDEGPVDKWEAWYHKGAYTATQFVNMLTVEPETPTLLGHTRAMTKGATDDLNNNHPIYTGSVLGIHNGIVSNDYSLFTKLKDVGCTRNGLVDSEAIFAALAYGQLIKEGETKPVLGETIGDILEEIEGSAAIAWLHAHGLDQDGPNPNELHLARLSTSPLCYCNISDGSLIFASTQAALHKAAKSVDQGIVGTIEDLDEGVYVRVISGSVVDRVEFTPKRRWVGSGYVGGFGGVAAGGSYRGNPTHGGVSWTNSTELHFELAQILTGDPKRGISKMSSYTHDRDYNRRIENIKKFFKDAKTEDVYEQGQALRVGDWVYTWIGIPWEPFPFKVYGQIVNMPQTFPDGVYFLRVTWGEPNGEDWEEMIVVRPYDEFEVIDINALIDDAVQDAEDTVSNAPSEKDEKGGDTTEAAEPGSAEVPPETPAEASSDAKVDDDDDPYVYGAWGV